MEPEKAEMGTNPRPASTRDPWIAWLRFGNRGPWQVVGEAFSFAEAGQIADQHLMAIDDPLPNAETFVARRGEPPPMKGRT